MEQIKVSDLATEFDIQYTIVISELKKIGVWVPSADTPVDPDIAIRIRRRLQFMVESEQEELAKAEKAKEKKVVAAKAKKSIKELGTAPRRAAGKRVEEKPAETVLTSSLKPRRGKGVYRRPEEEPGVEAAAAFETPPVEALP